LVIHKKEIAERAVDDIEPDIRTPLLRIAVVLNEGIQEQRSRKRIVQPRAKEVCAVMSIRETDAIVSEIQSGVEFVAQAKRLIERIGALAAGVKGAVPNAK